MNIWQLRTMAKTQQTSFSALKQSKGRTTVRELATSSLSSIQKIANDER